MLRAPSRKVIIGIFLALFLLGIILFAIRNSSSIRPLSYQQINQESKLILQLKKQDHIRGAKNPQLLLIVYSDFECPFCKKFEPTLTTLLQTYKSQVAVVFRHFPLDIHQYAQIEAEASECASAIGGENKFWQFHDLLFERTKSNGLGFSPQRLAPLAKEIGLDQNKFQECLDSGRMSKRVIDDYTTGQRLGITGTPTTIVVSENGKRQAVIGSLSYNQMKETIDALLK